MYGIAKARAILSWIYINYRQILNLRTPVLKFSIFGNDVKYQEFKATERSEGYLNSVLRVIPFETVFTVALAVATISAFSPVA